jgi:hypothetical protein
MVQLFCKINRQLLSKGNIVIGGQNTLLILTLLASSFMFCQNRIPPPPCYANGNSGLGGAGGEGYFLFSGENTNPIIFAMSTGSKHMNDILVLFIDTGAPGRHEIDVTVDDHCKLPLKAKRI